MSQEPGSRIHRLQDRALMLSKVRAFFAMRGVMEVDVPLLSTAGSIDLHIDLVTATSCGKKSYLHSSPEYGMKRLLAEGCGDIYQLSHVFRDSEVGNRHNPEFMMCEWYRVGSTFQDLIDETLAFVRLFLEESRAEFLTYEEAFLKYTGQLPTEVEDQDHVLAFEIEPLIGREGFTVIQDFPADQAALAQTWWNGKENVAKRFELFYQGVELANGYCELTCPKEQEKRLIHSNKERLEHGKPSYPIDHDFLEALKRGLPDSCGVAVGFDRLMMLKHHAKHISEVIPFAWK